MDNLMPSKKPDKAKIFAWTAYMLTHQPEEMKRVLRYGTPSDTLIKISEQPVLMTTSDGKTKLITFPESLNTRAGQNLLFDAAQRVTEYVRTVPVQAHTLYEEIKATLSHRRKDTLSNYLMVAEAVCHRAASEFKHEVLFAFDSIIEWVKSVYRKDLGYLTVRRALEALQEAGFFKVREWGKRGNRSKCTKVEIMTSRRNYILTYTSKVDDWMMNLDHAMMKVYARESTTRQDVLESRFHHYADQLAAEMLEESKFAQGARLHFGSGDKLVEQATEESVVEINEGLWDDVYIDRLLGRMVQPMQEAVPNTG
jgi:hypothetical protein